MLLTEEAQPLEKIYSSYRGEFSESLGIVPERQYPYIDTQYHFANVVSRSANSPLEPCGSLA